MKREELKPMSDLFLDMGVDVEGNRNYQPWTAYDKDEADSVMDAMEQRIKELEATISILETTEPKWISVDDELPKEGEEVIAFYTSWKHKYQQVAMFEDGEFIDLGGCALSPTHWMPLPPPPTTEDSSPIEKEK